MLKKFGEENLNYQLRQHFAESVLRFLEAWDGNVDNPDSLLDIFFDQLALYALDGAENFRVQMFPYRTNTPDGRGGALLLSLYEPELRFQKAILFRGRVSLNAAVTEEGNLFDTDRIKEEAAEMLAISQSACFASFSPQGIHVIPASGVLGDTVNESYLLKNFYYLNISDFVGNLFFKCFVGDSRPEFISRLHDGACRNLLEIRISATPPISQRALF